jgi:hypothetical protein
MSCRETEQIGYTFSYKEWAQMIAETEKYHDLLSVRWTPSKTGGTNSRSSPMLEFPVQGQKTTTPAPGVRQRQQTQLSAPFQALSELVDTHHIGKDILLY